MEQIFDRVAGLSSDDRRRYFEGHRVNLEIQNEVLSLLQFDGELPTALPGDIVQMAQHVLKQLEPAALCYGPYRLESVLGTGGMGTVYLAQRIDGELDQRVAIKLLQPGSDRGYFRERFLAERQILANLSHPNIATLLDAGHSEGGQPYLVMEYIEGTPIDVYATDFSIRQKLTLFLKVCAAVSYLHRNLVIHRDLKPANILVTQDGEPKLLDFGIAKILNLVADFGTTGPLLTPGYASPEQAAGGPSSTATDVYSLGAVLFKLLTGVSPRQFEGQSASKIASIISSGKILSPSALTPALKGDLEIILLKALRLDPQERYASVEQFADDLENYLQSRPIRARNGNAWYQTRKFLRRRWLSLGAAGLAAAGLSGGIVVAEHQRAIAQQRFLQVRQLATRFIELHDDVSRLPGSTRIREKMVTIALGYLDNLSRDAGDDSTLLAEIGDVYEKVAQAEDLPGQPNLGRAEDALQSLRKAIAFESRAAALDPAYRKTLVSLHPELAYLAMLNARFSEAGQNLDEAASLLHELRTEEPDGVEVLLLAGKVALTRADLYDGEDDAKKELPCFEESARLYFEYLHRKPSDEARVRAYRGMLLVAMALRENGRAQDSLKELRRVAPLIDALLARAPSNQAYLRLKMEAANYEGEAYDSEDPASLGRPVEAAAAYRRYADIARELLLLDPNNASAHLSLAIAYAELSWAVGRWDGAQSIRLARKSVRLFDEGLARNPNDRLLSSRRAHALRYLARAYWRKRNLQAARAAVEQAIHTHEGLLLESSNDQYEGVELARSRQLLASLQSGSAAVQ